METDIIRLERDVKASHEATGEFTLPDYLPEVSRLLYAECEIIPEGVYLKDGNGGVQAQLGGVAVFRVTWCAEDTGGAPAEAAPYPDAAPEKKPSLGVWQTALCCDYETMINLDGISQPLTCIAKSEPENVWCRVTAPRRLSLRCRIGSRVSVLTPADISSDIKCADAERLFGELSAVSLRRGAAHELLCSCDITGISPTERPVSCTAVLHTTECKMQSPSECRVRGDIIVRCLLSDAQGLRETTNTVRFDESVDIAGMSGGAGGIEAMTAPCRAHGRVTSLSFSHDGVSSRAEITYELEAESAAGSAAPVIYDAYSCSLPSEALYSDADHLSHPVCVSGNFTVSECDAMTGADTAGSANLRVETATGTARITGTERARGRITITGTLSGNVLLSGGENMFDAVPYTVPWKYEAADADESEDGGEPVIFGDVSVISVSARVDMRRPESERLCIDAELAVSATAAKSSRCRILKALLCDPSQPAGAGAEKASVTVFYPAADESLWDIAKRYRVPRSMCSAFGDGSSPQPVMILRRS